MNKLTILDGGMGRELKRIGAPFTQPYWSAHALMEAPEFVIKAHQNFIDAGAEIITVNSYACVPFHLGQEIYDAQGAQLAEKAAEIARDLADRAQHKVLVAGSLPPALGSYRPDLFEEAKAKAIQSTLFAAQEPYVDIWLAETVASLAEAQAIINILANTKKPSYISFTLMDEIDKPARLRSGESINAAIDLLLSSKIQGIFFNCCIPEVIEQAIKQVNQALINTEKKLEIGAYANSFTPLNSELNANDTFQQLRHFTPEDYLAFAKTWQKLGANVIGGCCGITPSHIAALSQWKSNLEETKSSNEKS